MCCGYSLEAPRRGASNEYPQQMFSCKIRNISIFFGWRSDLCGIMETVVLFFVNFGGNMLTFFYIKIRNWKIRKKTTKKTKKTEQINTWLDNTRWKKKKKKKKKKNKDKTRTWILFSHSTELLITTYALTVKYGTILNVSYMFIVIIIII